MHAVMLISVSKTVVCVESSTSALNLQPQPQPGRRRQSRRPGCGKAGAALWRQIGLWIERRLLSTGQTDRHTDGRRTDTRPLHRPQAHTMRAALTTTGTPEAFIRDKIGYLSVNSPELFSVSFTLLILSQHGGDDVIVTYC